MKNRERDKNAFLSWYIIKVKFLKWYTHNKPINTWTHGTEIENGYILQLCCKKPLMNFVPKSINFGMIQIWFDVKMRGKERRSNISFNFDNVDVYHLKCMYTWI